MNSVVNFKKITFNFMGVKFTKETKMPKDYHKFLHIISQIYLLDQMKNINVVNLNITYDTMNINEQTYEQFREIANNNSTDEMEVQIELTNNNNNNTNTESNVSEYREALKLEYPSSFETYVNTLLTTAFNEFKRNIETLICEEHITNLLITPTSCAECQAQPLLGYVYKCFVCNDNKTLCEKCSNNHEHPVLRQIDYRDDDNVSRPTTFDAYIKQVIQHEKQKLQDKLITELTNFTKHNPKKVQEKETNIKCNGNCYSGNIKGRVYRCLTCVNKCFCERCSDTHDHVMLVDN